MISISNSSFSIEVSPPEDPGIGCKGAPPRVNLYTGQFASSETDVAGFAQLQSFQSILLQEDSRMECKGAPPRVNLSKDCVHHQRLM